MTDWFWCSGCQRFILRETYRRKAWLLSFCERAGRTVRLTLRKHRPRTAFEAEQRNAGKDHGAR